MEQNDTTRIYVDLGTFDRPYFNPGMVLHAGKRLYAWRVGELGAQIRVGELDAKWRLQAGASIEINIPRFSAGVAEQVEDPRLFIHKGSVWMAYSHVAAWMCYQGLAKLSADWQVLDHWVFGTPERIQEKNWQFFDLDQELYAVYSIVPEHKVLRICGNVVELVASTKSGVKWKWGEPRGGTPPVLVNGEWFSFFHSHLRSDRWWRVYYVGFYAFSERPPFRITRISREPCLIANPEPWREYGPLVVFPGGAEWEKGTWLVTYGWHHRHCCVQRFDHEALLATCDTLISGSGT